MALGGVGTGKVDRISQPAPSMVSVFGSLSSGEVYERILRLEDQHKRDEAEKDRLRDIISRHERFQARLNELIARFAVGVAARKS